LRGAESDGDEQFVRDLAAVHGIAVVCERRDVAAYATNHKLSLETAARESRYEFFAHALESLDRVATAHSLDDQAETVLLKLARGAGSRGLAGIYPELKVGVKQGEKTKSIVRPLLSTSRLEIEAYLREIGQTWREDSSNRDLRHTRNRIRHGILPRLQTHVNPSVRNALAESADIARAEEEYFSGEVARILPQVWNPADRSLQLQLLANFPLALQRRLLRAAAASLGIHLEFQHVEELLASAQSGSRATLPGNWTATREAGSKSTGRLRFEPPRADSAGGDGDASEDADYEYELSVPGTLLLPEAGLRLQVTLVAGNGTQGGYNPDHLLDARFARRPLVVRNWRSGERFWPAHTSTAKKIKDLLQDHHVTGKAKRRCPVIASGEDVIWIHRLGVGKSYRAGNEEGVLIRDFPISEESS
jgi:tRNA(Ile)-lysidine synthase